MKRHRAGFLLCAFCAFLWLSKKICKKDLDRTMRPTLYTCVRAEGARGEINDDEQDTHRKQTATELGDGRGRVWLRSELVTHQLFRRQTRARIDDRRYADHQAIIQRERTPAPKSPTKKSREL